MAGPARLDKTVKARYLPELENESRVPTHLGKLMIGLLLVTHEGVGGSLSACAERILGGPVERLAVLSVPWEGDPATSLVQAEAMVDALDEGEGVLVLTDLFGATPANVARRLHHRPGVAVLAGLSLPMLMRAITYRRLSLPETMAKAVSGGRDGVRIMDGND